MIEGVKLSQISSYKHCTPHKKWGLVSIVIQSVKAACVIFLKVSSNYEEEDVLSNAVTGINS